MRLTRPDGKKRCACSGCSNLFLPRTHNHKYCHPRCMHRAYNWRSGRKKRRAFGMCGNGLHEVSPENTYLKKVDGKTLKICRRCQSEGEKRRYHASPEYRERQLKQTRDRKRSQSKDPEYVKARREYQRAYYEKNREHINTLKKKWYASRKEARAA